MEVGEQDLPGAEQGILLLLGLFDLDDHVGGAEDLLRIVADPGSGGGVLLVGEAAAQTGAALDHHLVAGPDQSVGAGGGEGDAEFLGLDFHWDTDQHRNCLLSCVRTVFSKTIII